MAQNTGTMYTTAHKNALNIHNEIMPLKLCNLKPKLLYIAAMLFLFNSGFVYAQSLRNEKSVGGPPASLDDLNKVFEDALTTGLLEIWYPKAMDKENGGFYSSFSYDWELTGNQNKMIVTQARHVWTTARAAALFPENRRYRSAAAHGFRFLKNKMWDKEYGGFFNLVDRQGVLIEGEGYDQYKRTYGNAFAIYGLAAYYALSKDEEVLDLAKATFHWLEKHAHDSLQGGYFPSITREGKAVMDNPDKTVFDNIGNLYKDQNTSIHLLEAFTALYEVWPDKQLEIRLKEMLYIVRDSITTKPGYLQLFFYRDWTPVSLRDSTAAIREANYLIDHVSFGHDIETAFLLLEASHALGKFEWDKTLKTAKMLVDHTLAYGFDPKPGGIYEQGYYGKGSNAITIVEARKNWWSQAEGLNALLLFSKLYPEEHQYEKQFFKLWTYVKTYVIDQEHGGWYSFGIDAVPEAQYSPKANIWKGPYHHGRALMNIIAIVRHENSLLR